MLWAAAPDETKEKLRSRWKAAGIQQPSVANAVGKRERRELYKKA
jgi:hypothetical protein